MSPTIITGKIVGYSGVATLPDGTQGYTTSSVTYTIKASIPSLTMPVEFTGQRPEIRLWPQDQLINVDALLNKTCIGVMINNDVRWHFFEPPAIGGCAVDTTQAALTIEEIRTRAEAAGGARSAAGTPSAGSTLSAGGTLIAGVAGGVE